MKSSGKRKRYNASLSYSSHSYERDEYCNLGLIGLKANIGEDYEKKNKHTRCITYLGSTIKKFKW